MSNDAYFGLANALTMLSRLMNVGSGDKDLNRKCPNGRGPKKQTCPQNASDVDARKLSH